MQPIHDRMPVNMPRHEQAAWLQDEVFARRFSSHHPKATQAEANLLHLLRYIIPIHQ